MSWPGIPPTRGNRRIDLGGLETEINSHCCHLALKSVNGEKDAVNVGQDSELSEKWVVCNCFWFGWLDKPGVQWRIDCCCSWNECEMSCEIWFLNWCCFCCQVSPELQSSFSDAALGQ